MDYINTSSDNTTYVTIKLDNKTYNTASISKLKLKIRWHDKAHIFTIENLQQCKRTKNFFISTTKDENYINIFAESTQGSLIIPDTGSILKIPIKINNNKNSGFLELNF